MARAEERASSLGFVKKSLGHEFFQSTEKCLPMQISLRSFDSFEH
jgi:hypothetical protein